MKALNHKTLFNWSEKKTNKPQNKPEMISYSMKREAQSRCYLEAWSHISKKENNSENQELGNKWFYKMYSFKIYSSARTLNFISFALTKNNFVVCSLIKLDHNKVISDFFVHMKLKSSLSRPKLKR